jgi:hypothetical protein
MTKFRFFKAIMQIYYVMSFFFVFFNIFAPITKKNLAYGGY